MSSVVSMCRDQCDKHRGQGPEGRECKKKERRESLGTGGSPGLMAQVTALLLLYTIFYIQTLMGQAILRINRFHIIAANQNI